MKFIWWGKYRFITAMLCVFAFTYGVIVGRYQVFPFSYISNMKLFVSGKEREKLNGRTVIDRAVLTGKRNMVVLAFGQSNAGNHAETQYLPQRGVYNLYKGKLYVAQDPMLGASGERGSAWTRLGERIVNSGRYDNVVFITIAEGASSISRWAPGGALNRRLLDEVGNARKQGIIVTHLLWHQGEADAASGTVADDYKKRFREMVASLRREGCSAPIYVAIATRGSGRKPAINLRTAQQDLVDVSAGIFPGPDTDILGYEYRYDGTHFSEKGIERVAELWFQSLMNKHVRLSN
jgi:lysophospholipase L1-like esterase